MAKESLLISSFGRKGDTFDGFVQRKHLVNLYCFGYRGPTEFSFLQKATFIKVVFAFARIVAPECLPLSCYLCGPYPKWFCCDGVSLTMRKEEVNWSTIERVHPPDQPFVPPEQGVLKHNERLLLPSVRTRALIIKFAKKQPDPLTEPEWKELKEALGRQCAPLLALLKDLRKDEKSRLHPLPITLYSFPGAWKNFLSVIGSPISMVWVFRPAVVGLLQHLMVTKKYTLEADQALSAYCPPLATALRSLQDYVLQPLHAELIQKGVDVVRKCYPDLPDTPVAPAVQIGRAHV